MTGIYDCFGYGSGYDVSFEERYKLIRKSGFDCVMLWWSNQFGRGDGYQEDVRLARRAGLFVENIHAPVHEQNNLSLDNLSGEGVFQSYLQCVADCCEYDIPTMVIHLPNDNNPLTGVGASGIFAGRIPAEQLFCGASGNDPGKAVSGKYAVRPGRMYR